MHERSNLSVDKLMTPAPVTTDPTKMVQDAYKIMQAAEIRHLPVATMDGSIVGMLSERDVLRAYEMSRDLMVSVKSIMTKGVVSVSPSTRASAAAKLMLERRLGALPILDEGALVGVVTETDFLRYAHAQLRARDGHEPIG